MGKSYNTSVKKRGQIKNHPHKDSKFYKDEFHERKGGKHKKRFDKFED